MPALPDRSGRAMPDTADVVVIGGGYAGINAARELGRRGVAVTLLEAHTLGWGASTRNGGIVHGGYKWGPRELLKRYGEEVGRALYRETLESYALVKRLIADEAIDCDFREVGHLELAYAPSHVAELAGTQAGLASVGVESTMIPRDRIRDEIGTDAYYGALAIEGSGLLHPGRVLRRSRRHRPRMPGPTSTRASGRDPSGARRTGASSSRPSAARSSPGTCSSPRTGTRTGSCRPSAGGSSRSGATSSRASRFRRTSRARSRQRAAPSSTRRTSSTTGTCRRTAG